MGLPANANIIVVQGYWLDELTGVGVKQTSGLPATILFEPVPLLGANVAKTPNLRDIASNAYLKTRTRVATVDPDSGYFAAQLVASNDPDLEAYGGRRVTLLGEDPFVIEVPYSALSTTVDATMAAKTGLAQGSSVRAIWLTEAAIVGSPPPQPTNSYLTSTQTLATIASGIETALASVPEAARDALAAALVAGPNVTITPNDNADTITISASVPSSYSDEQAQDAFAALLAAGTHSGISFAYNDAGNAISATVAAQSFTQSATKTANYTAADNEIVPLDTTSGTFTLTGPTSGKPFGFRWKAGTAAPTIAAPSGYTISGAASVAPGLAPSTSSGELVLWQAFGTDYQPLGGFKPQNALNAANDARYVKNYRPYELVTDDFASHADGLLAGTKTLSGHTWLDTGGVAASTVTGGRLTAVKPASGGWGTYPRIESLGADVYRFGCEFSLGSSTTDVGALTLPLWATAPYTVGVTPTRCHLGISRTFWSYQLRRTASGSFDTVASGSYTALTTGQHYVVDVAISGDTAIVSLPDGSVQRIVDPDIANIGGRVPTWEPTGTSQTDPLAYIHRVWADTAPQAVPAQTRAVTDSRYARSLVPSAASTTRSGVYDPMRSTYFPTSTASRLLRAATAKAAAGSLIEMCCIGDSRTAGLNVGAANSWPGQLRALVTAAGVPSAGTGLAMVANNATDSRWTFSTSPGWTNLPPYKSWSAAGATATFVSDSPGTVVDVYYYNTSGQFTITIDGGTPTTVTPAGGNTVGKFSVTGQTNATHTVLITAVGGAGYLIGAGVRQTTGLLIHNVAVTGSATTGWVGTGFTSLQQIVSSINPTLVSCELGVNDYGTSVSAATMATNLATILSTNNSAATKFVIAQTAPAAASASQWAPYVSALYDTADAQACPLIDLVDRFGTPAQANASGMLGSDSLHETTAGHADVARTVSRLLTS